MFSFVREFWWLIKNIIDLHIFNSHSFLSLLSIFNFFLYKTFFFSILILFFHCSTSNLISEPWIFNFSSQLIDLIRACGIFSLIWKKKISSPVLITVKKKFVHLLHQQRQPSTPANTRHKARHPHQKVDRASRIATKTHDNSLQHPRWHITFSPTTGHSPRQRQICYPTTTSCHKQSTDPHRLATSNTRVTPPQQIVHTTSSKSISVNNLKPT